MVYKSILTNIINKTPGLHLDLIVPEIFNALGKVFETKSVEQGLYASKKEQNKHAAVAEYLVDPKDFRLKGENIVFGDVQVLKNHPKTKVYQEYLKVINAIMEAMSMEELDNALVECEEFLHRNLKIDSGELEFCVKKVLNGHSELLGEILQDTIKEIEKEHGADNELTELKKRRAAELFSEVFGTKNTGKKEHTADVIPLNPKGRK